MGRIIAVVLIFAAIGILWTVVALITSKLVERRLKHVGTGIIQDTKDMIKEKIDIVESVDSKFFQGSLDKRAQSFRLKS